MNLSITLILAAALLLLAIWAAWRLGSRRHALPCPSWLQWMVELDNPFTATNRAEFIVGCIAITPGMTVLDAGCGPGRLTIPLAEQVGPGGRVVALDLQEGMLARVREKAEAKGLNNIEYLKAGLGTGTLASNRFDRAVMVTVLGEIPDRGKALEEVFRSLAGGGILAIVETLFDPHYQRHSVITALATRAGFTELQTHGNTAAYLTLFEKPRAK
jgi:ubiquinone/menaquinone biosynthesis C-methylase UbiE